MVQFGQYAQYYDLLYGDKDYNAEVDFLEDTFRAYTAKGVIKRVLDLGCGTGGHVLPLAQRGYQVTGVDLSQAMLDMALEKARQSGLEIDFRQGKLCSVDLGSTFDAVISMFAVISYQTTNQELLFAFNTVRRHLKPGGLFIFDGWFGPAVLAIRPSERVKMVNIRDERLIRLTRPNLDILDHTVTIEFTVLRLKQGRLIDEINETHVMRFLFIPEVELLCKNTGFEVVHYCPFMGPGRRPDETDWNVSWILRAI